MKDPKRHITVEELEKDLRSLGHDAPKTGLDETFKENLRSKLRENFYMQEGEQEEEKSILDKVIEGLTSWSKLPTLGALAATVAVVVVALNFGPKYAVNDFKQSVKIKNNSTSLSDEKPTNNDDRQNLESDDNTSDSSTSDDTSTENIDTQNTESQTNNINSNDGGALSSSPASGTLQNDNYTTAPSAKSSNTSTKNNNFATPEEDHTNAIEDYKLDNNNNIPDDWTFAEPPQENSLDDIMPAPTSPSPIMPGSSMDLEEPIYINLQLQTDGLITDQIAGIKTDLSDIVNMKELQVNIIDNETATFEISLSPRQIDALTSRLRARSRNNLITGEQEINSVSRSRTGNIKVHLVLKNQTGVQR